MDASAKQVQQKEWFDQWAIFDKEEVGFLFRDWIHPGRMEDFRGKTVLEAGCGGGPHTALMAPLAQHVTAVDLNTTQLAQKRLEGAKNVTFLEDDIASMDLGTLFDIVLSIGVVHHNDDPDRTAANLKRHVKLGGRMILWVYAKEGNWLVEHVVEPIRKVILRRLPRQVVLGISTVLTALIYLPVYTLYLLPLKFLPYFQYFQNYRKLPFNRNLLNVFDKLNAPQVQFLSQERVRAWFKGDDWEIIHLSHYVGVSWRVTAVRKI